MSRLKDRIAEELAEVRALHDGYLRPADVVEFARDPDTALHTQFEWDDSEAAAQYRLIQARTVIRMDVTVISSSPAPIRANVSLLTDRQAGNGYRQMVDVLADEDLRRQLLAQALSELQTVKRRYEHLSALARVWDAVDAVQTETEDRPSA